MHTVDLLQRVFAADVRNIELTGLQCGNSSLLIQVYKRYLCKIGLLAVIVFVRHDNRLLVYVALQHLPGAGANAGRGIILIIFIHGNDTDKSELINKGRLRLRKRETHRVIIQCLGDVQIADIHVRSRILHFVECEGDVLGGKLRSIGEIRIVANLEGVHQLILADLIIAYGEIILKNQIRIIFQQRTVEHEKALNKKSLKRVEISRGDRRAGACAHDDFRALFRIFSASNHCASADHHCKNQQDR